MCTSNSDISPKASKMKIDISKAEYVNILDSTNSLDILKRNGFTHNELMRALGEEQIDEAWANKRYITKNYEEIKEGGKLAVGLPVNVKRFLVSSLISDNSPFITLLGILKAIDTMLIAPSIIF